jgi:hypothetical protein
MRPRNIDEHQMVSVEEDGNANTKSECFFDFKCFLK